MSLKFTRLLARSLDVEKIKEKKMNEWMNSHSFRVGGQSNTVEDVEESMETPKRERIQKSFAVIVEVVIVGRTRAPS